MSGVFTSAIFFAKCQWVEAGLTFFVGAVGAAAPVAQAALCRPLDQVHTTGSAREKGNWKKEESGCFLTESFVRIRSPDNKPLIAPAPTSPLIVFKTG